MKLKHAGINTHRLTMKEPKMDVEEIQREYEVTMGLLCEQKDPKAVFLANDGKPVTVKGVEHYCRAMKVLFDQIQELEQAKKSLEAERDRAIQELRAANEIIAKFPEAMREMKE